MTPLRLRHYTFLSFFFRCYHLSSFFQRHLSRFKYIRRPGCSSNSANRVNACSVFVRHLWPPTRALWFTHSLPSSSLFLNIIFHLQMMRLNLPLLFIHLFLLLSGIRHQLSTFRLVSSASELGTTFFWRNIGNLFAIKNYGVPLSKVLTGLRLRGL